MAIAEFTNTGRQVVAETWADDDRELPAEQVSGELLQRDVPTLGYTQMLVGGKLVDPLTVRDVEEEFDAIVNVFCATGSGGGVDPTCSPSGASGGDRNQLIHPRTDEEIAAVAKIKADAIKTFTEHIFNSPAIWEQKQQYKEAIGQVINHMTAPMMEAVMKTVGGVELYNSTEDLTVQLTGKDTVAGGQLGGAFSYQFVDNNGTLHLDGDGGGTERTAREIYAHELGHALDFKGRHSGTLEWDIAFRKEIFKPDHPLSKYASKSHAEGLAEYFRLMNTQTRAAKDDFPECWACFKKWGYV